MGRTGELNNGRDSVEHESSVFSSLPFFLVGGRVGLIHLSLRLSRIRKTQMEPFMSGHDQYYNG